MNNSKVNCSRCVHRAGEKCLLAPLQSWDPVNGYSGDFRPCRTRNARGDCNKHEAVGAPARARKLWADYVATGAEIPQHLLRFDPAYDYAGPENSPFLRWAVPDTPAGLNIKPAAFWHDRLCEVGGDCKARRYADRVFLQIMVQIAWNARQGLRLAKSLAIAGIYWAAVRLFGRSSFNTGG